MPKTFTLQAAMYPIAHVHVSRSMPDYDSQPPSSAFNSMQNAMQAPQHPQSSKRASDPLTLLPPDPSVVVGQGPTYVGKMNKEYMQMHYSTSSAMGGNPFYTGWTESQLLN